MEVLVRKDIMILEGIKSLVRIIPILNIIAKNLNLCGAPYQHSGRFLMRAHFIAFLGWKGLIAWSASKWGSKIDSKKEFEESRSISVI
jgi:hypothetical protein